MLDIFNITAPIFLLIGLGYLAVHRGWFAPTGLPAIGAFVLRFALPAVVFKALSQRDFAAVVDTHYLLAYLCGSLVPLLLGLGWTMWVRRQGLEAAAMVAMGMSCANTAFIGFPVVYQVVGATASIALALCLLVENVVMIPLCLALADTGRAVHEPFWAAFGRALAGLPRNPLIIAILTGLGFAVLNLHVAAPVAHAIDLLAAGATAAALFFLGGSLVGLSLRAFTAEVIPVAVGKLLVHPLAVLGALYFAGPVTPPLKAAAVLMAAAPMLSVYPIFGQRHGLQGVCSARMFATTLLSFLTIATALAVIRWSGWI